MPTISQGLRIELIEESELLKRSLLVENTPLQYCGLTPFYQIWKDKSIHVVKEKLLVKRLLIIFVVGHAWPFYYI